MVKKTFFIILLFQVQLFSANIFAQAIHTEKNTPTRSRISLDADWKFSFGHATDKSKDFNVGTSYFTYLAKAGYAEGPASISFDDRAWRELDLPHDWAVEVPFSKNASHSHGYKATGPGFPETSVGWYRKSFTVHSADSGKRIFLEFDGVSRDAKVWVNGFYCGGEPSGYYGFSFDVSEFLNYNGENVIAVRADNSTEEGWYYEGGGIYRHVWLTKTNPLHVAKNGTFITSHVNGDKAHINTSVKVKNSGLESAKFKVVQNIIDANGDIKVSYESDEYSVASFVTKEFKTDLSLLNPILWDLDNPYLYQMQTQLVYNGKVIDQFSTNFGVRTIKFMADKGFFLNGKSVKLQGTNNHQDHAGVGCAIPDALQEWRIKQLKDMGNNAIRTSHNPPTPELLAVCDKLGVLVLIENRLMGVTEQNLDYLKRTMVRDLNHPSVILWSIGNEEWAIEGNKKGEAIAKTMTAYAKSIDTTRPITAGISGGWGYGISNGIDVVGFNYLTHGDIDDYHKKFPNQPTVGTEEGSTRSTRGVYIDDSIKQHLMAYDRDVPGQFVSIQDGWTYYAERDYLSGIFFWTGFDYRGESTPFAYPSVASYFGFLDLCGFPKDNYYYLKSWWTKEPVLHILPHWNWTGREGEEIDVWVYSNYEEVELFLNKKSFGKQEMKPNGRLEWKVPYAAGVLKAVAYNNGKKVNEAIVKTTGEAAKVLVGSNKNTIAANNTDLVMLTVSIADKKGNIIPNANVSLSFSVQGPAKFIGVGNGDPSSHENETFIESIDLVQFAEWKQTSFSDKNLAKALTEGFTANGWDTAFKNGGLATGSKTVQTIYSSSFELNSINTASTYTWLFSSIGTNQKIFLNGKLLANTISNDQKVVDFVFDKAFLNKGENSVVIVAEPYVKKHDWDNVNTNPGVVKMYTPPTQWTRTTFNGLAQIIVQSNGGAGEIVVTATANNLKVGQVTIQAVEEK